MGKKVWLHSLCTSFFFPYIHCKHCTVVSAINTFLYEKVFSIASRETHCKPTELHYKYRTLGGTTTYTLSFLSQEQASKKTHFLQIILFISFTGDQLPWEKCNTIAWLHHNNEPWCYTKVAVLWSHKARWRWTTHKTKTIRLPAHLSFCLFQRCGDLHHTDIASYFDSWLCSAKTAHHF